MFSFLKGNKISGSGEEKRGVGRVQGGETTVLNERSKKRQRKMFLRAREDIGLRENTAS